SLLELTELIAEITGMPPELRFEAWRPADQRYYVSDTRSFSEATGWRPLTDIRQGLRRLAEWIAGNVAAVPALARGAGVNAPAAAAAAAAAATAAATATAVSA